MADFVVDDGIKLNYHLDGETGPVILILNGIMMSTASWADFVPVYTDNNYRVLRVDFRDQGLSDSYPKDYKIDIHTGDIVDLLDHLGIEKVIPVGISYGGMVAMLLAINYPDRVNSMVLANVVARVTPYLKAASQAWQEAADLKDGRKFFRLAMPYIYSDYFYKHNQEFLESREEILADALDADWLTRFNRLAESSYEFDIKDRLTEIEMPVLLVAGERDILTPLEKMKEIACELPDSRLLTINDAGHASCYEKTNEFNTAVLGHLALTVENN
ncbi:MAG: alpha/beta fold hydrolase [Bacillota bacterium]